MKTQTTKDLQFIVAPAPDRELPALPPVPVPVALARITMRPVREFEIIHRPERVRFVWVQYSLWAGDDPYLPVPCVDFGERFFWNMHLFAEHLEAWTPNLAADRQRRWSQVGYDIIHGFQGSRGALDALIDAERDWLPDALWCLWATPQGPLELLAELERQRVAEQRRQMGEAKQAHLAIRAEAQRERRAAQNAKFVEHKRREYALNCPSL